MRGRGQDVVEELLTTVDYLRIMVGTVSDGREWLVSSDLITGPPRLLSIVRSTAAGWDTDDDTVAMSLFVQGYAYRIASTGIGSFVLSGDVSSWMIRSPKALGWTWPTQCGLAPQWNRSSTVVNVLVVDEYHHPLCHDHFLLRETPPVRTRKSRRRGYFVTKYALVYQQCVPAAGGNLTLPIRRRWRPGS